MFLLECKQLNDDNENLKISLEQGIARLTRLPLESIKVNESNCMTGQRPYCGVDVDTIRAHQRARRLMSGRFSGKRTKNKNKESSSYSLYHRNIDLTCEALSANITVSGKNLTLLKMSLDLLKHLQANNSLIIPLWDERVLYSSFMLSAIDGSSYSLHEAPETEPPPPLPTKNVPPLEVNLTPMIYAGASIVGLITLCVLWKFIKHSWLLYRKRFTPINSDRVDRKKVLQRQRIMEAMEENHYPPPRKCICSINSTSFFFANLLVLKERIFSFFVTRIVVTLSQGLPHYENAVEFTVALLKEENFRDKHSGSHTNTCMSL